MKTVFAVVSPLSETVALFADERKAIKMAHSYGSRFTVRGFKMDDEDCGCGWLVWARGMTESQIEEVNIVSSKRYVKTPPDLYAKACRKIMEMDNTLTIEELAKRIDKPVSYLKKIFEDNPEPHIIGAEVKMDETVLDCGKSDQQPSSIPHEYDFRTYE